MNAFAVLAFQASLTVAALLFGVLGFLYSVYATYSAAASVDHPIRPPIVQKIRLACKLIVGLLVLALYVSLHSLVLLGIRAAGLLSIAVALELVVLGTVLLGGWLAFRGME